MHLICCESTRQLFQLPCLCRHGIAPASLALGTVATFPPGQMLAGPPGGRDIHTRQTCFEINRSPKPNHQTTSSVQHNEDKEKMREEMCSNVCLNKGKSSCQHLLLISHICAYCSWSFGINISDCQRKVPWNPTTPRAGRC